MEGLIRMESVHTNEGTCSGMESFELCEAKTGYMWDMLCYTAKDTKLKSEVPGTDKSDFCKPSEMIGLDNYCITTPELSDMLNETEPDAIGTARSNNY
jgi:hypothetical protein